MKRTLGLAILLLVSAIGLNAQTATTSIIISAPVSLCAITPTPVHFYQNTAATISLASASTTSPACTTTGFNSSCTATAGTSPITPIAPATQLYNSTTGLLSGTIPASALSAAPGTQVTITVTCTATPLTMNTPVVLPNATAGISYSASLLTATGLTGGVPPYKWTLTLGSLPPGLALSSNGVITGTPLSSGSSTFGFTVTDSSGLALNFDLRQFDFLSFRPRHIAAGLFS